MLIFIFIINKHTDRNRANEIFEEFTIRYTLKMALTLECVAHEFECLIKLFENKLFEKFVLIIISSK